MTSAAADNPCMPYCERTPELHAASRAGPFGFGAGRVFREDPFADQAINLNARLCVTRGLFDEFPGVGLKAGTLPGSLPEASCGNLREGAGCPLFLEDLLGEGVLRMGFMGTWVLIYRCQRAWPGAGRKEAELSRPRCVWSATWELTQPSLQARHYLPVGYPSSQVQF